IPAVVGIEGNGFTVKQGQTILMIMPDGSVYARDISLEELQEEHLSSRKKYLEKPLVEVMCWQIEHEGYEPELIVDRHGAGFDWGKQVREKINVDEYRKIKNETTHDGKPILQGVYDVIASTKQPPQEIEIEEREISGEIVDKLALEVIHYADDIGNFTYYMWEIYDNLTQKSALEEGVELVTSERKIAYTNLEESKGIFIKKIAEEQPEMFIQAVFYGVNRHGMSRYIFRSYVVDYLKKSAAREFFKEAIKYGAKHGHTGDERTMDFQTARLFSHFAKEDPHFASEAFAEFGLDVRNKLLNELYIFYIKRKLRTKAFDSGFASFQELLSVLDKAAEKFNSGVNSNGSLKRLTDALKKGIVLINTLKGKNAEKEEQIRTHKTLGPGFNMIEDLPQILEKTQELLDAKIAELERITVKESEKPNAIILYADDLIEKGAVLDMEDTLKNTQLKQKKVLTGSKIILYVKKRKKEDTEVQGLKGLIQKSDSTIDVFIVEKSDLHGSERRDFDETKEMNALKEQALRKLNGENGIRPEAEQLLGIIRGHSNDIDTMYMAAQEVGIPVIIFGNMRGIYSFAEALREAIIMRSNPTQKCWYKYLSRPIQRLDTDAIRREFETCVKEILTKA
ncbi:MAG: hypothetical protein JSV93_03585, partial [Candidatus Omnitrophota bacterium]